MNDDTRKFLEVFLYTYVIRIICFIGIFGNIAILVVLARRHGTKETAFVYIRALAILDLTICVFLLGMGFVRCGDCEQSTALQRYIARVFEGFVYLPVANFAQIANLLITITMAVHRVFNVLQTRSAHDGYVCALRVNVRQSRRLAHRLVVLIVVIAAMFNSIRFFFYEIEEVEDYSTTPAWPIQGNQTPIITAVPSYLNSSGNEGLASSTTSRFSPSDGFDVDLLSQHTVNQTTLSTRWIKNVSRPLAESYPPYIRYKLTATPLFEEVKESFLIALSAIHFTELLVLTTVNIILIRILRLSKLQRKHLIPAEVRQRKRREGDDVTRLLILLVIASVFCHLLSPFSTEPIAIRIFGSPYTHSNAYSIQLAVNNTLTLSSHAITFFLYLVSRKFRRQVRRTCDCIINRIKSQPSVRSQTPNSTSSWTPTFKGAYSASPFVTPILCRKPSSSPHLQYL